MATKAHTPTPSDPAQLADYRPVKLRTRYDGWTAERQRTFLARLAETGSISDACRHAGVSTRSAYKLRRRPDAQTFATAWDRALQLATLRFTTIDFAREVKGTPAARPIGSADSVNLMPTQREHPQRISR